VKWVHDIVLSDGHLGCSLGQNDRLTCNIVKYGLVKTRSCSADTFHRGTAFAQVLDRTDDIKMWRVTANILNKITDG
jgi:hypothetical protein